MTDWLKVETSTPEKPEILGAASRLGVDADVIFARWFRLWAWADQNLSRFGHARNVTLDQLSRIAGLPGLAEALAEEGWLEVPPEGGVRFINFDRHNSKSGKERALAQERKRQSRERGHDNVTKMSRSERDKTVTREEVEVEVTSPPTSPPHGGGERSGDHLDTTAPPAPPPNGKKPTWKPLPDQVLGILETWNDFAVHLRPDGTRLFQEVRLANRKLDPANDPGIRKLMKFVEAHGEEMTRDVISWFADACLHDRLVSEWKRDHRSLETLFKFEAWNQRITRAQDWRAGLERDAVRMGDRYGNDRRPTAQDRGGHTPADEAYYEQGKLDDDETFARKPGMSEV